MTGGDSFRLEIDPLLYLHHYQLGIQRPLVNVQLVVLWWFVVVFVLTGPFVLVLLQEVEFFLFGFVEFFIQLFSLCLQTCDLPFKMLNPHCPFLVLGLKVEELRFQGVCILYALKLIMKLQFGTLSSRRPSKMARRNFSVFASYLSTHSLGKLAHSGISSFWLSQHPGDPRQPFTESILSGFTFLSFSIPRFSSNPGRSSFLWLFSTFVNFLSKFLLRPVYSLWDWAPHTTWGNRACSKSAWPISPCCVFVSEGSSCVFGWLFRPSSSSTWCARMSWNCGRWLISLFEPSPHLWLG